MFVVRMSDVYRSGGEVVVTPGENVLLSNMQPLL